MQKIVSERVILGSNHLYGGRLGECLDSLISFVKLLNPSSWDCLQCRPRTAILHNRDDLREIESKPWTGEGRNFGVFVQGFELFFIIPKKNTFLTKNMFFYRK